MTLLDWPDIHNHVFPAIPAGALFGRLSTAGKSTVLVTGCQRSGTRWLTKLLAASLHDAIAPKELEGCNFLVNDLDLPLSDAAVLILQTTFANIETESYAQLPDGIPVILLARNPFSVCWSLVYNWQNLALEYAYRSKTLQDEDRVFTEPDSWRMALKLYRQSMRSGMRILRDRPTRTRLLVYDELVQHVPSGLQALSGFLGFTLSSTAAVATADPQPSAKQQSLPLPFRDLITEHCEPAFTRIKDLSSMLGSRITLPSQSVK